MNCLEFRRHVGAEPASSEPAVAMHRAGCQACARHQDQLQEMDRLLGRAMRIDLPGRTPRAATDGPDPTRQGATPLRTRSPHRHARRWLAMAASVVAGVLVAATLWLSYPAPTLASEVIGHAAHEPMAWSAVQPLDPQAIAAVLGSSGARLQPGAGTVTFAKRCFFDRHWVPHLVVQTDEGPVTVFLLSHREVTSPTRIEGQGFSAVVLPAPRGSIAVVGRDVRDLDAIARRIFEAVEWQA